MLLRGCGGGQLEKRVNQVNQVNQLCTYKSFPQPRAFLINSSTFPSSLSATYACHCFFFLVYNMIFTLADCRPKGMPPSSIPRSQSARSDPVNAKLKRAGLYMPSSIKRLESSSASSSTGPGLTVAYVDAEKVYLRALIFAEQDAGLVEDPRSSYLLASWVFMALPLPERFTAKANPSVSEGEEWLMRMERDPDDDRDKIVYWVPVFDKADPHTFVSDLFMVADDDVIDDLLRHINLEASKEARRYVMAKGLSSEMCHEYLHPDYLDLFLETYVHHLYQTYKSDIQHDPSV